MTKFTKREILDVILSNNTIESGMHYIFAKLNYSEEDIEDDGKKQLRSLISSLRSRRNSKYQAANRMMSKFEKKNAEWLDSEFKIDSCLHLFEKNTEKLDSTAHASSGPGRPPLTFQNKSDRSKRKDASAISAKLNHDPYRLLYATRHAARRSGNVDLSAILNKVEQNSEKPAKIRKLFDTPQVSIRQKTPEEALAYILNNSLSKSVYIDTRLESISCGADIWPSYNIIREAKSQCRPLKEDILIQENKAEVSLQSLLNHTIKRIVKMQSEVIIQFMQNANVTDTEAVFICSWGFDGSSGHSTYKQSYASTSENVYLKDESLFVTALIPLRLLVGNSILWNNPASQSARFCRPIKMEFVRESIDTVLKQKADVEEQIKNLQVIDIQLDDIHRIRIRNSLLLTLIDGKILNIITNTRSMQTCPICHATPKHFNDLSNKTLFIPEPNSLQYGLSPLHAWIRIFECILHIAYRTNIKVWQVRSEEHKVLFTQRKKMVQKILWENLGLIVDRPKPGSGTTNDGNTARRAFANPNRLAELLELDCSLLCNLKTILVALSCHLPIDPVRFDELCTSTAKIYVDKYSWFPMPSTLHKILIHGADIISMSILPVGMLGEEGSEARNKNYKFYRQFHSRKHSREANLHDMFYRAIDTSDPIISSISLHSRLNKRKALPMSSELRHLLAIPDADINTEIAPESTATTSSNASSMEMEIDDNIGGIPEIFQRLDAEILSDNDAEELEN